MSAVYPYHPDRPRNMINTNKLFDLYYAAEDNEDKTGEPKPSSAPSVPVLTKPARSALIKRRKTSEPKPKRQIPARLKLFWDDAVTTTPQSDSVTISPVSSKTESLPISLPICLQASPAIDSNFANPQKTIQFQTPQHRSQRYEQAAQTSFVFSFPSGKQLEDGLEQQVFGPITYQHLVYVVCLGALLAFVWSQFMAQAQAQIQTQIESPYFPSSSFTITSATLTPLSAVRIFVAHQHSSQFSFTFLRTRLVAR